MTPQLLLVAHLAAPVPGGRSALPEQVPAERAARRALFATAGLAAIASGGLYLAAALTEPMYWDESVPMEDLDLVRRRVNGAVIGSSIAGGVAVLAAAGGLAVGWRF